MSASPGPRLQFFTDPSEFLAVTGDHLAADPLLNTIVATVADSTVARLAEGIAQPEGDWWLAVRDGSGGVVGAGMRTAPFDPRPIFLLPMPDEAAIALARALHERGERVGAVNGYLPAVRLCADELARLTAGRVEVRQNHRLHELTEVIPPAPAPGGLVAATEDDLDLVEEWFAAFGDEADEQAGRPRGASAWERPERARLLERVRDGDIWFWADAVGERVHLTGIHPPSFGVVRIAPVYTPPERRGRRYASNAVAELSRRVLARGNRVCLYTDVANPVSNQLYLAIGYRPVAEMAQLLVGP